MDVAESVFESEWEKGEVEEMYRHVFSEKILADRLKDESNIPFTAGEKEYITNSVEIIVDNKEAIDKIIADHIKEGSIRRIDTVDLSILLVAVA